MLSDEFLETARRLASGTTEGDWRSAISRAYYSVFHFARDLCETHGLSLGQGGQAHSNLYIGLNNCGDAATILVAGRIDDLRGRRIEADYVENARLSQQKAQNALAYADGILADLHAILTVTPIQQIISGAKRHLRAIGRIP
jgi:uncharacterized protein (UPF0332 family)